MIDDDHLSPRERRLIKISNFIMYVGLASTGFGAVVVAYSLIFTGD